MPAVAEILCQRRGARTEAIIFRGRASVALCPGFALAGRAGTLPGDDFLERRPDDLGDLVWDVRSTFVRD